MKLGIIGSRGHIGYVFESIGEADDWELSAFSTGCDDAPEQLEGMAKKAGFSPEYFADWRTMLEQGKLDMVAVDGPFDLHAQMAAFALERNIPVFCEKPIALNLADLERVKAAQRHSTAKILSMVGLRYEGAFQHALNLVRAGKIGKVKQIFAQKSYKLGDRPDFYRHRATFGGTIPWVGSHALDWIMAFSGSSFASVYATQNREDNHGHGDLEMSCHCIFTMRNQVQALASIDYLRPMNAPTHGDDRVRVAGTAGVLEVRSGRILLIDAEGEREIAVPPPERKIFSDFARSVAEGVDCWVSTEETFELTRACLLARDAADNGTICRF
ncbi:MAG: Gfo/Idh/MocA family oxidoreductase [Victivallaceae bacterium]|nr:Gfo/Idh/MocA family oxidoreductase [Victivallaceae bacterium]